MAIRVRKDGTMWCAAHTEPEEGDTYIDDGLHYHLSVEKKVIVALPMPEHLEHCQWWWANAEKQRGEVGSKARIRTIPCEFTDRSGGWMVEDADRPGCIGYGETQEEARESYERSRKAYDLVTDKHRAKQP